MLSLEIGKEENKLCKDLHYLEIYIMEKVLEALKTLEGKKAIVCVGGGSMKRNGFLDRAVNYLQEAGMEVKLFA